MFQKFSLILMLFLFSSCVQVPTNDRVPSVTVQNSRNSNTYNNIPIKKVGYFVNVSQYPIHTHIGTTSLTNFEKRYSFNWKIPLYIHNRLQSEFNTLRHIKLINLAKYGISSNDINGLLVYNNGRWKVRQGKENTYAQLTSRLGLSTVVIINEAEKQAINDCGMMGCKKFKAKGYGLLTHSFMNSDKFYSATALYVHIYKLKPLLSLDPKISDVNHAQTMTLVATSKNSQAQPNKIGFSYPKNFKNWKDREFAPFRLPLIKYIDGMSQKIVDIVRSN